MPSKLDTKTPDRTTRELHRAIVDFIRVYQFRDRDNVCCYDISVTQSHALDRLVANGPSTLNELAAAMYLEKSTVSRVVDGLEGKGYVVRRPHPNDGRSLQIDVTARGRKLSTKIEADMIADQERLFADLSPEMKRTLASGIARLAEAACARVSSEGGTPSWS